MNLHEYQAKELLFQFDLPILQGKAYINNLKNKANFILIFLNFSIYHDSISTVFMCFLSVYASLYAGRSFF